ADASAVQNAAAHVAFTKARLEGGNGTLLDFQRANALYQSDKTLLERAQFLLVRLQEQLGILLGEDGPVDVTTDVQLPAAPVDARSAIDDAQRLRSDVQLTRERLAAATKVRRESWADFMPTALASATEAAKISADVVRLTLVSYRAGLSTNIEVIDAQLAALNADVAAALAENNERQAQLDLLLATGRFP